MTDVFAIDPEAAGFRKNNLDWRKFRDTYNRVSATKRERGIKPLPLSLLLKLFGPQKVVNTYVSTRRTTNELDYSSELSSVFKDLDMKSSDKDPAVTKMLEFPGNGLIVSSNPGDVGHESHQPKSVVKTLKRDALPVRPAFQRGIRVPGRYFPKPSPAMEDHLVMTASYTENMNARDSRPRTHTPRFQHVHHPGGTGSRGQTSQSTRNSRTSSRIVRGPICKATETLAANPGRTSTWSGAPIANSRHVPALQTNGLANITRTACADHNVSAKQESVSAGFAVEARSVNINGNGVSESNNELMVNDMFPTTKKVRYSSRQVSFPKSGTDFSAVLQGRPKTLHPRDFAESLDGPLIDREPRARTHVGFVDNDT